MYSKTEQQELNKLTDSLVHHRGNLKPKQHAEALRKVINYHDWRYYVLSEPSLTDFDYDVLFKELKQLETDSPEITTADSPTQRVARSLTNEFEQVAHLVAMLSLDNSYNADDLNDFDRRVRDLTGATEIEYCVEPK